MVLLLKLLFVFFIHLLVVTFHIAVHFILGLQLHIWVLIFIAIYLLILFFFKILLVLFIHSFHLLLMWHIIKVTVGILSILSTRTLTIYHLILMNSVFQASRSQTLMSWSTEWSNLLLDPWWIHSMTIITVHARSSTVRNFSSASFSSL